MVCLRLGFTSIKNAVQITVNSNLYSCLFISKTSCKTVKSIRLLSTSIERTAANTGKLVIAAIYYLVLDLWAK